MQTLDLPRAPVIAIVAALALLGVAGTATAHEHVITEDCRFALTVGWKSEPPFAGQKNGLDLRIERITNTPADPGDCHHEEGDAHGHGGAFTAVKEKVATGVLGNVTVTYVIAGQSYPDTPAETEAFDFRAAFGSPGSYTGEILPTREGKYTIKIKGEIDGVPLDVSVVPHEVLSPTSIMFPQEDLTAEEASAKIAKLERDLAALRGEVASMKTAAQSEPAPTPEERTNDTPAPGALLAALAAVAVALVARRRSA